MAVPPRGKSRTWCKHMLQPAGAAGADAADALGLAITHAHAAPMLDKLAAGNQPAAAAARHAQRPAAYTEPLPWHGLVPMHTANTPKTASCEAFITVSAEALCSLI